MSQISRREFLKSLSVMFGALATEELLTSCGPRTTPSPLTATQPTNISTSQATSQPALHPSTSNDVADLVIARNGDPEEMVRRAFAALGGLERYLPKGSNVIIKPNICVAYHTYEYAATTNPWVVGALVKLCFEAGASSVKVMDYPFGGSAEEAYARSGIAEQVQISGGEMVTMSRLKYISTEIPNGKDLLKTEIYDDVLKTDIFIDVPIAKHHNLAGLTLGMKNLMGVIKDRPAIHRNFGQRLADLTSLIMPTLTVIDAVRILMNHGPTGGNLSDVKQMNTVIASTDIIAADSYAATLFGKKPEDLAYIQVGAERGLGRKDLNNLRIEEINVGA